MRSEKTQRKEGLIFWFLQKLKVQSWLENDESKRFCYQKLIFRSFTNLIFNLVGWWSEATLSRSCDMMESFKIWMTQDSTVSFYNDERKKQSISMCVLMNELLKSVEETMFLPQFLMILSYYYQSISQPFTQPTQFIEAIF